MRFAFTIEYEIELDDLAAYEAWGDEVMTSLVADKRLIDPGVSSQRVDLAGSQETSL